MGMDLADEKVLIKFLIQIYDIELYVRIRTDSPLLVQIINFLDESNSEARHKLVTSTYQLFSVNKRRNFEEAIDRNQH
jgi:hypothetical protein